MTSCLFFVCLIASNTAGLDKVIDVAGISLVLSPTHHLKTSANSLHDFHVSRCEIHWDSDRAVLEIACHMFLDDFEEALSQQIGHPVNLGADDEDKDARDLIVEYMWANFSVQQCGVAMENRFVSTTATPELSAFWVYMEVPGINVDCDLVVTNSVLFDAFNDQKNILSVSLVDTEQMFVVNRKKPKVSIPWK